MQNHKLAGRAQSVKKSTVRMVENHLANSGTPTTRIQELCSDAEESAAERDRLKAKLMKLRGAQAEEVRGRARAASPLYSCTPRAPPSFVDDQDFEPHEPWFTTAWSCCTTR